MCSKIVYGIATAYTTGGNVIFIKLVFLILSNLSSNYILDYSSLTS